MSTPLKVSLSKSDPFDSALIEISKRGHHSKCAFGNKTKIVAAESGDVHWSDPRAKYMPERAEVRFNYGGMRFAQELTTADVTWLDKFDTGEDVRSRTITLDPEGPYTKVIRSKPAPKRTSKPGRTAGEPGCNSHANGNSGRAKRMRTLVNQRIETALAA